MYKPTIVGLKDWEKHASTLTKFFLENFSLADVHEGYATYKGHKTSDEIIKEIQKDEYFNLYSILDPDFDQKEWLQEIRETLEDNE